MAIEAADLGIYDFDLRSGQVTLNDRYLRMLGYAPGEIEFTQPFWFSQIHPDDQATVTAILLDDPQRALQWCRGGIPHAAQVRLLGLGAGSGQGL
jgi:PAS domain-containing protein